MADKTIGELPAASEVQDDSLLVMEQQGEARNVRGEHLKKYAREAAAEYTESAIKSAEAAKKSADAAAESARDAADVALHPPILKDGSDHWWTWSTEANDYVESDADAGVSLEVVEETITGEPGTGASVTNLGTKTDPRLQFTLPRGDKGETGPVGPEGPQGEQGDTGPQGEQGLPGVSPTVEVSKSGKDTTITITDAEGPHVATVRDGEAAIPDHLIVGSESTGLVAMPLDADTLEGHDASYFSVKEITEKALQRKPGENVLHNSRWNKLEYIVNQRNVSGTISTTGYFIDRWRLTNGTVQITDGGLVLNGTIVQILEHDPGDGLVASVLTSTGLGTATYTATNKTFTITATGQTILAAKLEVGSEQTLAHQSGTIWVLNDPPPDYQQELAKCQQYQRVFYRNTNTGIVEGHANSSSQIWFPMGFVTMRAAPTVTGDDGSWEIVDKMDGKLVKKDNSRLVIFGNGSTGLVLLAQNIDVTQGERYTLCFVKEKRLIFDANL